MEMKTKLSNLLEATETSAYRDLIQNLLKEFQFEEIKDYATIEVSDTKESLSEDTCAGIDFVTAILAKVTSPQDAADKIFSMTCTQVWNFMAKMASDKIEVMKNPEDPESKTVVERIFWRHTLQWAMAASVSSTTCKKIGIRNPNNTTND